MMSKLEREKSDYLMDFYADGEVCRSKILLPPPRGEQGENRSLKCPPGNTGGC